MVDVNVSPQEIAKAMKLRYVSSDKKGYSRQKKGKGFIYLDTKEEEIKDPEILDHIKGLVIPPAWTDVWISPYPNGHLQATGYDVKVRKQYRYHSRWSKVRNDNKFGRILEFGKKLPALRKQINKDLRKRTLNREKVIAIALSVMNETAIRAGNSAYEKTYGSYGLTTLKNKHVSISGAETFFKFVGKKGVKQQIKFKDKSLSRLLKNVKELPGQELFQYVDENGEIKRLDSGDINDYLKNHMHEEFTSKDFRTWAGCIFALELMAVTEDFDCDSDCKKNIISIIDGVAARLGNTRTVSKKYYIHPDLITSYEAKKLDKILKPLKTKELTKEMHVESEKAFLKFLKQLK